MGYSVLAQDTIPFQSAFLTIPVTRVAYSETQPPPTQGQRDEISQRPISRCKIRQPLDLTYKRPRIPAPAVRLNRVNSSTAPCVNRVQLANPIDFLFLSVCLFLLSFFPVKDSRSAREAQLEHLLRYWIYWDGLTNPICHFSSCSPG